MTTTAPRRRLSLSVAVALFGAAPGGCTEGLRAGLLCEHPPVPYNTTSPGIALATGVDTRVDGPELRNTCCARHASPHGYFGLDDRFEADEPRETARYPWLGASLLDRDEIITCNLCPNGLVMLQGAWLSRGAHWDHLVGKDWEEAERAYDLDVLLVIEGNTFARVERAWRTGDRHVVRGYYFCGVDTPPDLWPFFWLAFVPTGADDGPERTWTAPGDLGAPFVRRPVTLTPNGIEHESDWDWDAMYVTISDGPFPGSLDDAPVWGVTEPRTAPWARTEDFCRVGAPVYPSCEPDLQLVEAAARAARGPSAERDGASP